MDDVILKVENLVTAFDTEAGQVRAVDDVSFFIREGEVLGLAGESGCGKSVTAQSIMRLIKWPPGKIDSGEILLHHKNGQEPTDVVQLDPKGPRMRRPSES